MKKRLFFIMALFALLPVTLCIMSCGDDDNDPYEFFYGKWGNTSYFTYDVEYYIFNSDGTYYLSWPSEKSGTYTFDGSHITLDGGFPKEVTFSEDRKMMTYDDETWRKK